MKRRKNITFKIMMEFRPVMQPKIFRFKTIFYLEVIEI